MAESPDDRSRQTALPRTGSVLADKYRLEEKLASGGMGVIMLATDLKMNREVAVKLLHPQMRTHEQSAERFQREIRLAKVLSHPNIVQVFDYGQTEDETLYIVMERLDGEDLDSLLKREGPQSVDRTIEVGLQLLDGLAQAHAQNVIHRDLKPSNIFLTGRRRGGDHVKLLDFGVAKSLEQQHPPLTSTDQLCGTVGYMPPESLFDHSPGKNGDVYATGLLLLEMLLGRQVFDGDNPLRTLFMHLREPIPMPSIITGTPLGRCIRRATSKHPADRHPDAAAMLEDLTEAVDSPNLEGTIDPEEITEIHTDVAEHIPPDAQLTDLELRTHEKESPQPLADTFPNPPPSEQTATSPLPHDGNSGPVSSDGPTPTTDGSNSATESPSPPPLPTIKIDDEKTATIESWQGDSSSSASEGPSFVEINESDPAPPERIQTGPMQSMNSDTPPDLEAGESGSVEYARAETTPREPIDTGPDDHPNQEEFRLPDARGLLDAIAGGTRGAQLIAAILGVLGIFGGIWFIAGSNSCLPASRFPTNQSANSTAPTDEESSSLPVDP